MDNPTSWAIALKSFASNSSGSESQKDLSSSGSLAWPVTILEDEEGSSLMTRSMCCWSTSLMAITVWQSSSLQVRISFMSPSSQMRSAESIIAMRKVLVARHRTEATVSSPNKPT